MKALTIVAVVATSVVYVSAGPSSHAGRNVKSSARKPGLRKTRVTSRKLGDADYDTEEIAEAEGAPDNRFGLGSFGNILQPAFLLNLPVEVLEKLTGAGAIPNLEKFFNIGDGSKLPRLAGLIDPQGFFGQALGGDILGETFTTARNVANGGFETLANSVADRGHGILDMAGGQAQAVIDKGLAVGSNTWQAAEETARGIRDEGKAVAGEAAAVAGQAVTVGERTYNNAVQNPIRLENFLNLNDLVARPIGNLLSFTN